MPQSWLQLVDMWSSESRAGATEIAQGCAGALIAYAEQAKPGSPQEVERVVVDMARRVLRSHAAMATVVRLLNDVLLALNNVDTVRLALDTVRRVSNEYNALVEQANALVVESAARVVPETGTIVTISYSTAVAKSLILASKEGHQLKVVCLESRPGLEGRDLAGFLGRVGVEVLLVVDANGDSHVRHADLVLVGVDSMGTAGIVNKVGTGGLALAAHANQVPVLAIGDTSKTWPDEFGPPIIPERDPHEVWDQAPPEVKIYNTFYDVTPWELVGGVITERGLTDRATICDLARAIPIDPRLKQFLGSA